MEVLRYISEDKDVEIKIATYSIESSWERFRKRVFEQSRTYCDYYSSRPGWLSLADVDNLGETPILVKEEICTEWKKLHPVFFETNIYSFSLRFTNIEGKPQIIHQNREVVGQFNYFDIGDSAALLTGNIDFLNEPGLFPLKFRYKPIGKPERTDILEFRVVSPKLDTKEDYNHILQVINREYENLVFKYLTKTYQNLQRGGKENNNLIWLSIFRSVINEYVKAMEFIVNKPHVKEQHRENYSKADRIRRWTSSMAEEFYRAESEQILDRKFFRHEITLSTADTRENRFVKYTINNIGKKLNTVICELKKNFAQDLSEDETKQLTEYQSSLFKLSNNRFFRGIGKFEGFRQESLVLQKRTGYAQVYRTWFILNSGLSLYQGNTQIGTRPIWELYELWCFLKMKELIAKILGINLMNDDDAIYVTENKSTMLDPFKQNEVEHTIQFHKKDGTDVIELKYQHTYNRHKEEEIHTATTEQRPDMVLNIKKPDGFVLTYLYDAKYRVLDDKNASDMDNGDKDYADYPPSDAINQMHRYRDAIYYGSNRNSCSAKEIIGGYILFPGRTKGEKVRNRYFFESIEKVNIGAFPLLPSVDGDGDSLLKEHLTSILLNKSKYEQIKDSIPQRGLNYTYEIATNQDVVLIGFIKSKEDLELFKKHKLYYVRAGFENGSLHLIPGFEASKYLLLHNKDERHLYKLDGRGPRIISAEDLKTKGFSPNGSYYMVFTIEELEEVEIKGFSLSTCKIRGSYRETAKPYFTTIKDLTE